MTVQLRKIHEKAVLKGSYQESGISELKHRPFTVPSGEEVEAEESFGEPRTSAVHSFPLLP